MLSQIGGIILQEETLKKIYRGWEVTKEEDQLFQRHPSIASELIGRIPRMEKVAEIIAYQEKHFDGSGTPVDSRQGDQIPLGARIIKVLLDFDILELAGNSKRKALEGLKQRSGWYDSNVLAALESVVELESRYRVTSVKIVELAEGMILAEDIKNVQGILLTAKGQPVSRVIKEGLLRFSLNSGIPEPIRVIVPLEN